jgi:aromatic-L-amino-acid decarboxylase
MALQHHGLSGYRASIEHDIALAQRLAASLKSLGYFEVFEPQQLSIVCFRYKPRGSSDPQALSSLNKVLLEKLQLGGKIFLSSTVIDSQFWLRACIVNPRTSEEDIDQIPAAVEDAAKSVLVE